MTDAPNLFLVVNVAPCIRRWEGMLFSQLVLFARQPSCLGMHRLPSETLQPQERPPKHLLLIPGTERRGNHSHNYRVRSILTPTLSSSCKTAPVSFHEIKEAVCNDTAAHRTAHARRSLVQYRAGPLEFRSCAPKMLQEQIFVAHRQERLKVQNYRTCHDLLPLRTRASRIRNPSIAVVINQSVAS